MCISWGRDVSFSESLAYVLNGWLYEGTLLCSFHPLNTYQCKRFVEMAILQCYSFLTTGYVSKVFKNEPKICEDLWNIIFKKFEVMWSVKRYYITSNLVQSTNFTWLIFEYFVSCNSESENFRIFSRKNSWWSPCLVKSPVQLYNEKNPPHIVLGHFPSISRQN